MIVKITIDLLGGDAGPFNVYSNSTGAFLLVAAAVDKALLVAGYSLTMPNGTTITRVQSMGECTNYEDITVSIVPTLDCTLVGTAVEIETPPVVTVYTYNLTAGVSGCDGAITFVPSGSVTVYSDSPTLGDSVALYTLPDLQTLISYSALRSVNTVYELSEGVIILVATIGSGC